MIKNIIFDFGDIFINLDKNATYRELAKLGVTKISDDMIKVYHNYEMGLISTDNFVAFFYDKFNIKTKELIRCWNAILLDFPRYRLTFIKELSTSKKFRLFLLSNTNELHITWIQNNWGNRLYNEFKNYFEQFYLSHQINLRKPTPNIYNFVLNQNKLKAKETLFIDDIIENTNAAKALGIHVWNLIPDKEDVIEMFTRKEFLV